MKGLIVLLVAVLCGALGGYLLYTSSKYSILVLTIAGVLLIAALGLLFQNSSPTRAYESKVNSILNTYDSVLVKSSSVPNLDDRNIVVVLSIDDLVDAQLEIRKPICYLKQTESCSFVLLDSKEAYVYVEKVNEDVVSPVEIAIKESKIKNKNKDEMDSEMLRDIDKTTVIKLSNQKSYRVSPIRKKKKTVKKDDIEEDKKEKEEKTVKEEKKEVKEEKKEVKEEKKEVKEDKKKKSVEEIDDVLNKLDSNSKKKKTIMDDEIL